MIKQVEIGIDPGLRGCISVLDNGVLTNFKMPETFKEISNLFKPYGRGKASLEQINLRPNFNQFANSRMDVLKENFVNLKNALDVNEIEYQLVSPKTWIKFHGLSLPKGQGEKGLDYSIFDGYEKDMRHLKTHLSIETNVPNDEIVVGEVKHILDTSGKFEARKMLCDDYTYLSKSDLKKAIEEVENSMAKFRSHEKTIRKNRYKDYANKIYIKSLIGENQNKIARLTNELQIDLMGFFFNNQKITPKELKILFKSQGKKPLTLAECDAVLILLYQLNN